MVVGIIIRNQSNKAAIFGIVDQFKKINEDTVAPQAPLTGVVSINSSSDDLTGSNAGAKLQENMDKASSVILKEEMDKTPAVTMFFVQLFNSLVPAVTAILVKDALIKYVEAGSGFLAPVFIIIYPCKL